MPSPAELLALAKRLLDGAANDVEYRNVVGRAYYAAFHAAKAFHASLPSPGRLISKAGGEHENLIQMLERPGEGVSYGAQIASKEIAAQMRMAKALREIADYKMDKPVTVQDAEDAIGLAEEILRTTAKYRSR